MYIFNKTSRFIHWVSRLPDLKARAKINIRIERAMAGSFGDVKPVGEGVFEMRIPYGPGYRVYYARQGRITWLLLCGGDKSGQASDIEQAKAAWKALQGQQSGSIH